MEKLIQNNSDFLFVFEAILNNPNGDPDQENKPRMDYDTQTNLVTDVRLKRYVREYLKQNGQEIFVDMEGDSKVGMDARLENIFTSIWDQADIMRQILNNEALYETYQSKVKAQTFEDTAKKLFAKKTEFKEINRAILTGLVRLRFSDIRMFGSAFAVEGFNKAITGPIQINWGYSLNEVFLVDSNTIASIMNEGNSTFGKDYRVKYSLLAFHGSINQYAANETGLTEQDVQTFRDGLWNGISASPTRSKLNQYPKLYLELVYNEGFYNGHFGDLRTWLETRVAGNKKPQEVVKFSDLVLDFSRLEDILEGQKGEGKPIKEVIIRTAADVTKPAETWN